jgi:hypothetical protein
MMEWSGMEGFGWGKRKSSRLFLLGCRRIWEDGIGFLRQESLTLNQRLLCVLGAWVGVLSGVHIDLDHLQGGMHSLLLVN